MSTRMCFEQVEQRFLMPYDPHLQLGVFSTTYTLRLLPQAGVQAIIDKINTDCQSIMVVNGVKKGEIHVFHSPF